MSDIVARLRWTGSRTSWDAADAQCAAAADEIERLRGEVKALRVDAKRWRWARDQELPDIMDAYHQHPDRFDERVDAALDKELSDE